MGIPAKSVEDCLCVIAEMTREAQRAANETLCDTTRLMLLAKRDALDEVKFRVRDGRVNSAWARTSFWLPL